MVLLLWHRCFGNLVLKSVCVLYSCGGQTWFFFYGIAALGNLDLKSVCALLLWRANMVLLLWHRCFGES